MDNASEFIEAFSFFVVEIFSRPFAVGEVFIEVWKKWTLQNSAENAAMNFVNILTGNTNSACGLLTS